MTEIEARGSKVLVQYVEPDTNLVLPDTMQQVIGTWKVVNVGEGRLTQDGTLVPIPLSPGDEILFLVGAATKAGDPDDFDGRKLAFVDYSAVLAVVRRPEGFSRKSLKRMVHA